MTARFFGLFLGLLSAGCSNDSYVVGALCTAIATCPNGAGGGAGSNSGGAGSNSGGAGSAGTSTVVGLTLDLTGSGVDRLPQTLLDATPAHFLIADDAAATLWPARVGDGFDVASPSSLTLAEPAPFADPGDVLSHAGAVTFSASSVWADTSAGALALEAVFRGEPGAVLLSQRDANGGLEWSLDADGRLNLSLDGGAGTLVVSSQALVADAWHHCLAFVDATQSAAQMFCNGQAGPAVSLPAGFTVGPSQAPASLGSASSARLRWAELASWQAASFGVSGAWTDLARERFARLVGTYADGAGEPLPFADVRASGAYLDMSPSDAPERRRLHPVGADWPRIVCRPTDDSARTCGLLVEAASSQIATQTALLLENWQQSELTTVAAAAVGPTGASSLYGVTASTRATTHTLELSAQLGDGPAVLSLFARAGSAHQLRAELVGGASATFDLAAAKVVANQDALVSATEPWGDGLVRLSYAFDVKPGVGRVRLTLLSDAGAAAFAGDNNVSAYLGDVELSFRSFSTPLPTFGSIEPRDLLVYPAGDGNLPAGPGLSISADVWLPAAPLVGDAAVVNANFSTRYDQQINLYIQGLDGSAEFVGLQGKATPWLLVSGRPLTDGSSHTITASVTQGSATLDVDGTVKSGTALPFDTSVIDRFEIGNSSNSSGALTGIVRRVRIAPP